MGDRLLATAVAFAVGCVGLDEVRPPRRWSTDPCPALSRFQAMIVVREYGERQEPKETGL